LGTPHYYSEEEATRQEEQVGDFHAGPTWDERGD